MRELIVVTLIVLFLSCCYFNCVIGGVWLFLAVAVGWSVNLVVCVILTCFSNWSTMYIGLIRGIMQSLCHLFSIRICLVTVYT